VEPTFDELVAEAEAAPIDGWDFTWLKGRATEDRPTWRYSELVARRSGSVATMLDLQSGGGEMLVGLPRWPPFLVASEGYLPNIPVAGRRVQSRGGHVVACHDDRAALPFASDRFELITSRHPIATWWDEIARVLQPGGAYLSQQVGSRSVGELTTFMMGPQPASSARHPDVARHRAERAGLTVVDLRHERLRTVFYDVGAVVYFLRLVIWIVPGFSVESYRTRLFDLHKEIRANGPFVAHASRFLIEAHKPG
jgi:SAM-dependent methyltransferase